MMIGALCGINGRFVLFPHKIYVNQARFTFTKFGTTEPINKNLYAICNNANR